MHIKDKVFIVTGGASGLGAITSAWLAARGARILIADLNSPSQGLSDSVKFVSTDVSDSASAKAAVDFACDTFGSLHGLINCAGVAPAEKVLGKEGPHRLESFSRAIAVNLVGSFNMLRLAAQAISERAQAGTEETAGVIINTASVAAYDGQIGQAAYSASKGGIVGMTLPIARELARSRIRVMTIAPGIMATPMLLSFPQEVQDSLNRSVPFPARMGKPEEFAQLVGHIIENDYLNGEVIRLDGAIRMAPR
ncbi:MAG: SDR family NAD(P)-dependent oxidoreductase [Betaproteobacteria bacterium]|jgi:NAD(P)-dependent dehydrogenase (short-subunit alcohol dehydrogenase family)|nr:SDR family NAD(P)-dependent oxidoreductase [Betaproteobacteria bacterium]